MKHHTLIAIPTLEDKERLLSETVGLYPRAHAIFSLGFAGLRGSEIRALDVRHVTANGMDALGVIVVPRVDQRRTLDLDQRREEIDDQVQRAINAHLRWRRRICEHYRLSLRTFRDEHGVERCATCGEVADFLSTPLFRSRQSARVTLKQVGNEFRSFRDSLRLNPALQFNSLRLTPPATNGLHDGPRRSVA